MPVLLIAVNYVRTQWLPLLIMTIYLVGIGGVFSLNQQRPEVLFFIRSQPLYVIFLAVMMAVPSIRADRTSRRIIAVLSKGIHRWEYLGGILGGCGIVVACSSLLIWAIARALCLRSAYPTTGLGWLALTLCACGITAAAVGLFYSTFLHPFLATAAASITLLFPYLMRDAGVHPPRALFPVSWLVDVIVGYSFARNAAWSGIIFSALLFAVLFWVAAAAVFARRDVTISPE